MYLRTTKEGCNLNYNFELHDSFSGKFGITLAEVIFGFRRSLSMNTNQHFQNVFLKIERKNHETF
jgi:hypothetical protein